MNLSNKIAGAALLFPLLLAAEPAAKDPAKDTAADKDAPAGDLARFADGDQLRGQFGGLSPDGSIVWQRADFSQPVTFQTTKLRQIVLRGGKATRGIPNACYAQLVNDDRIPGTLVELNPSSLVLDTPFAGRVSIPRDQLVALAPNPFGGAITYCGPFNEDGWKIVGEEEAVANKPKINEEDPGPAADKDDKAGDKDAAKEEKQAPWAFSGSAWYSRAPGPALIRESGLGDLCLLRFTASWRNRFQLAVAFHADFEKPEPKQDEAENKEDKGINLAARQFPANAFGPQSYPAIFGNSYVLSINSGYTMLHRCSFDEDGKPVIDRVQSGNMNVRIPEAGESVFELRCDRKKSAIFLYVDGEFASQWDESAEGYSGKGNGFGFQIQGPGVRIRLSDILAAEWNGMTDSARSMDSTDRDVMLLCNGTDRFSGTVSAIRDDQVVLDGAFAKMNVPVSKVAELRFAKNRRAEAPENPDDDLTIHFPDVGQLSGKPVGFSDGAVQLEHPFLGKLMVNLEYASILDFQPGNSFLDDWDSDF